MKPTLIIQLILAILITLFRFFSFFNRINLDWLFFDDFSTLTYVFSLFTGLLLIYSGLFTKSRAGQMVYFIIGVIFLLINLLEWLNSVSEGLLWRETLEIILLNLSFLSIVVTIILIVVVTVTQSRSLLFITKTLSWLTPVIGLIYFVYIINFYIGFGFEPEGRELLVFIDLFLFSVIVIPVSLINYQVETPELSDQLGNQFTPSVNGFKYCQQCGNSTSMDSIVCENCNAIFPKIKSVGTSSNDSIFWGILGFCIPLVGLILFFTWNQTQPKNAKYSGIGALIGTILGFISLLLISFIIFLELIY